MPSTKMPGEFQLIQHLQTILAQTMPAIPRMAGEGQVILGIGDDCAVLQGAGGKYLLVTTDMLVEDVHFSRAYSSLREIGQKAMIVNISDIAAMSGEPKFAFISLALPASFSLEDFDELWQGIAEAAQKYSLLILGGDTNASFPSLKEHGLVINITLIGEVWPHGLITRQGARQGDLILLTGQVGDSSAGLDLLQSYGGRCSVSDKKSAGCEVRGAEQQDAPRSTHYAQSVSDSAYSGSGFPRAGYIQPLEYDIDRPSAQGASPGGLHYNHYLQDIRYQQAIQRHRVPVVRLAESRIIGQHHLATAMIDVSDGVAGDLRHLCNQGPLIHLNYGTDTGSKPCLEGQQRKAGAILWSDRIPISGAVTEIARLLQKSAISYALCGGEDYELLFTVPPDLADKARHMIEQETGTPVSIIGEITDEAKGIRLIDAHGQIIPFPESGFDHFRKEKRGE